MRGSASTISLTTVLPEIMALIPAAERQLAEQVLHVPRLQVDGELADTLTATPRAFDFIVADGVVLKQSRYAGRNSLELLGPGDVLAPPLTPTRQLESRATSSYQTRGQASLAVIESRFRTAARRWPQLSDVLHDRLARQTHRASMHLAILHIARAEDRLLALFSDLAERFGDITSDGIVIDVELTHDLIGQLIGSRRPTVSAGLEELSTRGALIRTSDHGWLLERPRHPGLRTDTAIAWSSGGEPSAVGQIGSLGQRHHDRDPGRVRTNPRAWRSLRRRRPRLPLRGF